MQKPQGWVERQARFWKLPSSQHDPLCCAGSEGLASLVLSPCCPGMTQRVSIASTQAAAFGTGALGLHPVCFQPPGPGDGACRLREPRLWGLFQKPGQTNSLHKSSQGP